MKENGEGKKKWCLVKWICGKITIWVSVFSLKIEEKYYDSQRSNLLLPLHCVYYVHIVLLLMSFFFQCFFFFFKQLPLHFLAICFIYLYQRWVL